MKQKALLFLFLVLCVIYFNACTSGSYKTGDVTAIDTTAAKKIDTTGHERAPSLKGKSFAVKTPPHFVLSLSANYNLGVSETSQNYTPSQYVSGDNFGVKNGFGLVATGKIPLERKAGNLRLIINSAYNKFISKSAGDFKYNVFSLGFGLENSFTPRFLVKPFVGAAIMGSIVSGSANYSLDSLTENLTIKNSFRLGFTLYAGVEYGLSNNVGINIGARFMNVNTWLKSSKDDRVGNVIGLRDAFSSPPVAYGGWKNFAFTSFFIGTSIYFGVGDRIYKF